MADDTDGADKAKPKSRTKLIIMAAAAVLLLGGGGGAYVMLSGGGDHGSAGDHAAAETDGHGGGHGEKTAEGGPAAAAFFVDLPEMLVNLATIDREKQRYLRLAVALEVEKPEMAEAIKPMMPRVLDSFQTHLRELRPDDIRGSSGVYRLKEELLRRVNTAIAPAKVDAVLFKDIVVQ
jgi:flagellar FliL protein